MKEQNKTPEKELNKMEISNVSDAEFKTLVIRMLKELTGYFHSIKKTQAEMKVTLSEIKKKIYREPTVEWVKPKIKSMIWNMRKKKHSIRTTRRKKNQKKNEDSVSSLWDIIKCTNIQIREVQEGEEKKQEI